ncbi:protein-disulfide reductase DsbD domain-containing protein [Limoniibacter endophyticus]|nr:protein-disulfide reductase DsbD domain-containing protein [Limoniibacter endophyticus]
MTKVFLPVALSLFFSTPFLQSAHAGASGWFETEGARIRLLASRSDTPGVVRGALEIELEPGWKTYWRDPGDSGVAPEIDTKPAPHIANVEIGFPPPKRFEDKYGDWAGYKERVALPLTFTMRPGQRGDIAVHFFLGVCQDICVPVDGQLAVPVTELENLRETLAINRAFEALPKKANEDFSARIDRQTENMLDIRLDLPEGDTNAVLFVAGSDGYRLAMPEKKAEASHMFSVEILARPDETPSGPGLAYTLESEGNAVAGYLPYPVPHK